MASRPPPRMVVRRHDDTGSRRRRWWVMLAWLGSLVLAVGLTLLLAGHAAPALHDHRQQHALLAQIDDLKQQVANLQRSAQVNDIAERSLRDTLSEREGELGSLRADLGFYARLVGGDGPQGLKLQEVKLQPVSDSDGWNLLLSLTQNAKHGKEISGTTTVSVEGLQDQKVITLDWAALGDSAEKDGMPFQFLYFQQLQGTIVLPAGFRPTRLHIQIKPVDGSALMHTVAWGAALSGNITSAQGDHDAQP